MLCERQLSTDRDWFAYHDVAGWCTGEDACAAANAAAGAARGGAEATQSMSAAAGRASYVSEESLANISDPGAMAVAFWLEAVSEALQ